MSRLSMRGARFVRRVRVTERKRVRCVGKGGFDRNGPRSGGRGPDAVGRVSVASYTPWSHVCVDMLTGSVNGGVRPPVKSRG